MGGAAVPHHHHDWRDPVVRLCGGCTGTAGKYLRQWSSNAGVPSITSTAIVKVFCANLWNSHSACSRVAAAEARSHFCVPQPSAYRSVGSNRALDSTNVVLNVLGVEASSVLVTVRQAAIGAVVVCMLMAVGMVLMALGRTSLEKKIDEQGTGQGQMGARVVHLRMNRSWPQQEVRPDRHNRQYCRRCPACSPSVQQCDIALRARGQTGVTTGRRMSTYLHLAAAANLYMHLSTRCLQKCLLFCPDAPHQQPAYAHSLSFAPAQAARCVAPGCG